MSDEIVHAKIRVRRGPESDFIGGDGIILDEGEFGLVLDSRELYIGYGSDYFPAGNLRMISELDGVDALRPARGNYDMGGNRINNVANPIDGRDVVNLQTLIATTSTHTVSTKVRELVIAANTGAPVQVETDTDDLNPRGDSLNAISGAYDGFFVHYSITRDTGKQAGILMIVDSGVECNVFDQNTLVGNVGITFSVAHVNGVRRLYYTSTPGNPISIRFSVKKWGSDQVI